ncbi:hypothetical protein TNCV_2751571 [Trichonephila clavipes]|nr:hypothetical protein TNCV_2751571 [Trichonephila clavipes]
MAMSHRTPNVTEICASSGTRHSELKRIDYFKHKTPNQVPSNVNSKSLSSTTLVMSRWSTLGGDLCYQMRFV